MSTSLKLKFLCNVTWPAVFSMLSLYNSWRLLCRRQETQFRRANDLRLHVQVKSKVPRCRNTTNISLYFITREPSLKEHNILKQDFFWIIIYVSLMAHDQICWSFLVWNDKCRFWDFCWRYLRFIQVHVTKNDLVEFEIFRNSSLWHFV